jgi:hypothetical protein
MVWVTMFKTWPVNVNSSIEVVNLWLVVIGGGGVRLNS